MRQRQLWREPFCQCPHCVGKQVRAEVVDHKIPHRGDSTLFFDENNLQSMTKAHHDSMKQSEERGGAGFLTGFDELGSPLNKAHPFYEQR
jgi:5-methylcytosine-specific restriction enzyme A